MTFTEGWQVGFFRIFAHRCALLNFSKNEQFCALFSFFARFVDFFQHNFSFQAHFFRDLPNLRIFAIPCNFRFFLNLTFSSQFIQVL